jgi:hypothetical protein
LDNFSSEQQKLIAELIEKKIKVSIDKIVDIRRMSNGKIVFIENGNRFAGFQHILTHADDFAKRGIYKDEIDDAIMTAITQGTIVGYQRLRPIYEMMYNGKKQYIAVTVGDNGFIVGANPARIP